MFKNKTYSLVGFLLSLVCLFYIPAVFYTLFLHSFAQPSNDILMMLYLSFMILLFISLWFSIRGRNLSLINPDVFGGRKIALIAITIDLIFLILNLMLAFLILSIKTNY